MEPVFVIGILSSIPIVAILSNTLIKIKKMELEKTEATQKNDQELLQTIRSLSAENQELRQRIENVETIVTLGESQLRLHEPSNEMQEKNIKKLADNGNEIAKILLERQSLKK